MKPFPKFGQTLAFLLVALTSLWLASGVAHAQRVCEEKDLIRDTDRYLGDVCYSRSQTRGAGTIPTDCQPGTEKQGSLCYAQCRSGYRGSVTMCVPDCPSGFRDDGLYCAKGAPYGRGAGYPWKFGDALNDSGMISRCEAANGAGNCEKNGLIFYPRCRSGYVAIGSNICTPQCPPGMVDIGVSCQKITYDRGVGRVPSCAAGLKNEAGLCYGSCVNGTTGIGPVCWADKCPTNFPIKCGAMCARNNDQCAKATSTMVTSPLKAIASSIGLALSGGATATATVPIENAEREAYKQLRIYNLKIELQNRVRAQKQCTLTDEAATLAAQGLEALERYQGTTDLMARTDPTGISGIVDSYAKPLCDQTTASNAAPPTVATAPTVPRANAGLEQQCAAAIQGKVAWNRAGSTAWNETNIRNLCQGTTNTAATIACFQGEIQKNDNWSQAISTCKGR